MEWKDIIIALIGLIGGGGMTALLMIPQKKRQAELDNDYKVTEQWKELYERTERDNISKSTYISDLHKEGNDLRREINRLSTVITELELKRCDKIDCTIRKPPFGKIEENHEDAENS